MPLSEFHPAITKGKPESSQSKMANCSSDLSFMNDEFAELLWDNGPIVMHGQSNRPRKSSFHTAFSSNSSGVQEKDSKDAAFPKIGHFRATESKVNNFSPSGPSTEIRMTAQDDDIVPCINYPIEDSLHNDYCSDLHSDYCSEFLSAYYEGHLNSINSQNNTVPATRSSCSGQAVRDSHNVEASEPSRIRTSQQFQLPQQYQSSVQGTKSRATDISTGSGSKAHQDGGGTSVMNFTHFSKPIAIAKANLQSIDRLETNNKATTAMSSNPMESTVIESTSGLNSRTQGQLASVPPEMELRSSCKPPQEVIFVKQSEAVCEEDSSKENNKCNTTNNCSRSPDRIQSPRFVASVALGRHETEKGHEAVVASSSMCSGSSAGAAPNDHKHGEKRKHHEGEESGYQSEDLEDESVGLKKPASVRSPSTKRSRAAEVHNLSERRRRDRINEKMRALQELIPNCNKTDKASMLDEAIEYLKTLQMHVQIMSMGRGLCMPPMMMPHIRAPTMAHFSPMGVGMGMGIGLGYGMGMYDMNGSPGCPLITVPPIHGPRFPYPSIPGMPSLHQMPGSTGLQMFRIPVQGFPMPMPHQPPSGSLSDTTASPTVSASGSKDQQQQNIKLEMKHKSSTADSQIPTSTQV